MREVIVDTGVDVSTLTEQAQKSARELAALRLDAARYRWLRSTSFDEDGVGYQIFMAFRGEALDFAIDAAMSPNAK